MQLKYFEGYMIIVFLPYHSICDNYFICTSCTKL